MSTFDEANGRGSTSITGEAVFDWARRSVVEMRVSTQAYDADRPWVKRYPAMQFAQAAIVAGAEGSPPLLLTSAQMVAGATMIEVERDGRPPRAPARVVHQDRELNLALVAVDQPGFFDGLRPLTVPAATPTTGTLYTVRWRAQQFEVAATRVKRMVVAGGYFGRLRHAFLLGQTDLSGGGWAEPVVANNQLIGLASSQDDQTANVIPAEIVGAYVAAAAGGEAYPGFAVARFAWEWNLDPALAAYLGQEGPQRGVLIRNIPLDSTGHGVLEPRDLLLRLDGHDIDSCGYYLHPRFGRLEFTHIVMENHFAGDIVEATLLRKGQEMTVSFPLRRYTNVMDLIPLRRGDEAPPYVIAGGLVFLELDCDYLRTWGDEWWNSAPVRLVTLALLKEGAQQPDRRRIIVLSQVLPSAWTLGYDDCRDLPVMRINGRMVTSIQAVIDAFAAPVDGFHFIEFLPNTSRRELVLDAATLDAATARILEEHQVGAPYRLPVSLPETG